jgi:hypothetical protein
MSKERRGGVPAQAAQEGETVTGINVIRKQFQSFLENEPLYKKIRIKQLTHYSHDFLPERIFLQCPKCKAERPFEGASPGRSGAENDAYKATLILKFYYVCAGGCGHVFQCWAQLNYTEQWIWKIGQLPMWLPAIPADIAEELGEDAELYKKALRNMAENYGIGACACLRRLIEKYINPLLRLLYEVKQDHGATAEELAAIEEAIAAKDFATKTRFAAEIAPTSIMVEGHNPLREIHERLSVGLHTLDEETATEYATAISNALEFIIRRLRREHEERKAYAAQVKKIRTLPTS